MAAHETNSSLATSQVSTDGLCSLTTSQPSSAPTDLYPPQGPAPAGTKMEAIREMENAPRPRDGEGIEGEEVVWEGQYALRNFAARIAWRAVATVALLVMAIYTWGYGNRDMTVPTLVLAAFVAVAWIVLGYRMIFARLGHYYRLTNRRLFVSTGAMRRRRDQLELLRVTDVFTRQTWSERLLSVGTVVVVSSEKALPTFYLPGVADPKRVMDLVWHHARAERDQRSVRVQEV